MSSMRNAIQRRNHRERQAYLSCLSSCLIFGNELLDHILEAVLRVFSLGQPEERKKWGLLEKHKDYSLRARDHHAKKAKLAALKQRVLQKNPDEFYFGMLSRSGPSTTGKNRTGTVNGDRGNEVLSQEASRLYKTQDIGYVRTMRNQTLKEVRSLEERLVLVSRGKREGEAESGFVGKKTVFVDDEGEAELRVQEAEWEEEVEMEKEDGLSIEEKDLRKIQRREREKVEGRLAATRERLKALSDAEEALEMQRARMAKSATVGGVNKSGVKFKIRERKR
ncbi:hypothetical protein G7Y89_g15159 [Cudoniella acicularis]|uniref:U3 small nucleolar RNA-associated protein 11 n=1 Tax=Cudoniella acicularis TaxID=354080 RepID=A0A8H4QRW4_9HELO|nr:hypothetical protein G7Y89_g15159 [Cudoniella acicularis]